MTIIVEKRLYFGHHDADSEVMTDTTTTTRRLVNCSTAFIVTNRHGSTALMLGHGADGEPERAMAIATSRPAEWTEGDLHYRVCGVAIVDVHTAEQWLWPLETSAAVAA